MIAYETSCVSCPIHPTISAVGSTLPLALLSSWTNFLDFSVISNGAFIAAALFQEFETRSASQKTTLLKSAPVILAMIGAFSFTFHTNMGMHTSLHTLDIFFGWVLALHGAGSGIGCALTLIARNRGIESRFLLALPFVLFVIALHLLAGFYDEVYDWQVGYFGTMAGVIFASGVFVRVEVIRRDLAPLRRRAGVIALLETATVVAAVISALFVQSQQAGVRLHIYSSEYSIYHGLWHIQLALAFSIFYTRLLDGVSACDACDVRTLSPLDVAALASVWTLAIGSLVLKESRAPLLVTHVFLAWNGLAFAAIALSHWSFRLRSAFHRLADANAN